MPIIKQDDILSTSADQIGSQDTSAPEPDYSFKDKLYYHMQKDNFAFGAVLNSNRQDSLLEKLHNNPKQDDYDPVRDEEGIDDFVNQKDRWHALSKTHSSYSYESLKNKFLEEDKMNEVINATPWYQSLPMTIAAMSTDPMFMGAFKLIGKGVQEGRALVAGAKTGAQLSLVEGVHEGLLQSQQTNRTKLESILNITSAGLLGGTGGALARKLSKAKYAEINANLKQEIEDVIAPVEHKDAGAAVNKNFTPPREELTMADMTLVGEKVIKATAGSKSAIGRYFTAPVQRLATSTSLAARTLLSDIAAVPYFTRGQVAGRVTHSADNVSTNIAKWDAVTGSVAEAELAIYKKYVKRIKQANETPMNQKNFFETAGKASFQKRAHDIEEINQVVAANREGWTKKSLKELIDNGKLEKGWTPINGEEWMHRMWSRKKIAANRGKLSKIIQDRLDEVNPQLKYEDALYEIANQIINKMEGMSLDNRALDNLNIPYKTSALKERVFDIPTKRVHDFIETDIRAIRGSYLRKIIPELEYAKKGLSQDLSVEMREVQKEFESMIEAATTKKEKASLTQELNQTITDFEIMRDLHYGKRGLNEDPSSAYVRTMKVLKLGNLTAMLGHLVPHAIGDVALPFLHSSFKDVAKAYKTTRLFADEKLLRLKKNDQRVFGTAVEVVTSSRFKTITGLDDVPGLGNKFESGMEAVAEGFGKYSGSNAWNDFGYGISTIVSTDYALSKAIKFTTSKLTKTEKAKMAREGLSEDMMKRVTDQFNKYGEEYKGVKFAKTNYWDDREVADMFNKIIKRSTQWTINTPSAGLMPNWMTDKYFSPLGQFQSFFYTAQNQTFIPLLQRFQLSFEFKDAAELAHLGVFVTTQVGLGYAMLEIDRVTKGREMPTGALAFKEAMDKVGIAPLFFEINNKLHMITNKLSGGEFVFSIDSALNGDTPSRYYDRGLGASVLGPTASTVEKMWNGLGVLQDPTRKEIGDIRKLIPYNNLFYIDWFVNILEEELANSVGAKGKRKPASKQKAEIAKLIK